MAAAEKERRATMPAVEDTPQGAIIRVRVQPKASREEIGEEVEGRLRVRVAAPPVEGAANEAVIRILAKALRVGKSTIELLRGERSREKDFLICGLSAADVQRGLGLEKV